MTPRGSQDCFGSPAATAHRSWPFLRIFMLVMWEMLYSTCTQSPASSVKYIDLQYWKWALPHQCGLFSDHLLLGIEEQSPRLWFRVPACFIRVWFVLWRRLASQLCSPIKISLLSTQPENVNKQWGKTSCSDSHTHTHAQPGLFTFLWSSHDGPRVCALLYVFIRGVHPRWHLADELRQREEEEEAGNSTLKMKQCRGGAWCGRPVILNIYQFWVYFVTL